MVTPEVVGHFDPVCGDELRDGSATCASRILTGLPVGTILPWPITGVIGGFCLLLAVVPAGTALRPSRP
jgi:hypothetical protein